MINVMKKLTYQQMQSISDKVRIECKSNFPSYINIDTYNWINGRIATYMKRSKDVTYTDAICSMSMFSTESNDSCFVAFSKPCAFTHETWAYIMIANECQYISYEVIKANVM